MVARNRARVHQNVGSGIARDEKRHPRSRKGQMQTLRSKFLMLESLTLAKRRKQSVFMEESKNHCTQHSRSHVLERVNRIHEGVMAACTDKKRVR
jgi:hypothetical protein